MSMQVESIVALRQRPVTATSRSRATLPDPLPPRRTVLKGLTAGGMSLGLTMLGIFPMARKARAEGYWILDDCPSYSSDDNCSPGCGPSLVRTSSCEYSGSHTGYHKSSGDYRLRINECYAGKYDGWNWLYSSACGDCQSGIKYRCHDGRTLINGSWVKTICRYSIACYGRS